MYIPTYALAVTVTVAVARCCRLIAHTVQLTLTAHRYTTTSHLFSQVIMVSVFESKRQLAKRANPPMAKYSVPSGSVAAEAVRTISRGACPAALLCIGIDDLSFFIFH